MEAYNYKHNNVDACNNQPLGYILTWYTNSGSIADLMTDLSVSYHEVLSDLACQNGMTDHEMITWLYNHLNDIVECNIYSEVYHGVEYSTLQIKCDGKVFYLDM